MFTRYHWLLSFVGGIMCIVVMFIIQWVFAILGTMGCSTIVLVIPHPSYS